MSLKKTLIFSTFLHFCSFAALLLSADLLGGNDKVSNEKVFFVKLTAGFDSHKEDISKSGNTASVVETKRPVLKKPVIFVQKKAVSVKPEAVSENNNISNTHDLNTQEEPVNNVLLADYKAGEDNVVDISYGQETAVNASYNLSSFGKSVEGRDKGVIPQGIIEIIRNSIEKVKAYPLLARKKNIEGTVYISFRISPYGIPQELKILKSSGSNILDAATLEIVRRAAPLPYIDSPVELPLVFQLN